ncbi:MAG: DUF5928 domain-containing protein [Pseudomonadota bacterium]
MARIAFLLLAHRDPAAVAAHAKALTAHGDGVVIHYDLRSPQSEFTQLQCLLESVDRVAFARRIRCGWGSWSLVQASLAMIAAVEAAGWAPTHFYLLSGDCFPTKTRRYIDDCLAQEPSVDRIEAVDFFTAGWIRTGLKEERVLYRHPFNERRQPWLFYRFLALQRSLGLKRRPPKGLALRIGSQWWLLRAETVRKVVAFLRDRPDVRRFFQTAWIPDEIAFQTIVAHLVPAREISVPPTHALLSDYGMPVQFYADHRDYLRTQPQFFARKISPEAQALRADLLTVFTKGTADPVSGGPGTALYQHLAGYGRIGSRYAERFWLRAIEPARNGDIRIIVAVDRALALAAEAEIARFGRLKPLGHLFDSDSSVALDLGNLETGRHKRGLHRRAFLNLIVQALDGEPALLCVDARQRHVIADLTGAAEHVRLLVLERPCDAARLEAEACGQGLLGAGSGPAERRAVLAAAGRSAGDALAAIGCAHRSVTHRFARGRSAGANRRDLQEFLQCGAEDAAELARALDRL